MYGADIVADWIRFCRLITIVTCEQYNTRHIVLTNEHGMTIADESSVSTRI